MMDMVLERLQTLEAELAAIDPSHELAVADMVASMASALRDTLACAAVGQQAECAQMIVRRAG